MMRYKEYLKSLQTSVDRDMNHIVGAIFTMGGGSVVFLCDKEPTTIQIVVGIVGLILTARFVYFYLAKRYTAMDITYRIKAEEKKEIEEKQGVRL